MLVRCRYLFLMAEDATDGIIKFIPTDARFRCRMQATVGKAEDKERSNLQTKRSIDASSVSRSFFFLLSQFIGQKTNCTSSRISDSCLSVGGSVTVEQHLLYVRLAVENLSTQLDVGYLPLVTVVLKCPAAYLQSRRHFLVGEKTLTAQCRTIVNGHTLVVVQQSFKVGDISYRIRMVISNSKMLKVHFEYFYLRFFIL